MRIRSSGTAIVWLRHCLVKKKGDRCSPCETCMMSLQGRDAIREIANSGSIHWGWDLLYEGVLMHPGGTVAWGEEQSASVNCVAECPRSQILCCSPWLSAKYRQDAPSSPDPSEEGGVCPAQPYGWRERCMGAVSTSRPAGRFGMSSCSQDCGELLFTGCLCVG